MKLKVTLSNGEKEYSEVYDSSDMAEEENNFNECTMPDKDGEARPAPDVIAFEHYTRSLYIEDIYVKGALDKINEWPDYHIAFGMIECIAQSDEAPPFMYSAKHMSLKVERT